MSSVCNIIKLWLLYSFSLYSRKHKAVLTDHCGVHILQLPKWKSDGTVKNEKERWIYLFREGKNTDIENPPEILETEEMRQVMKVLDRFSENERDYFLYQSRLEA
ncbi:MAG: hypothetical protein GY749_29585, partial [Desulfobacteraceae bacterium]|nr:hypothetical protein [Desulfobacteraceae bacterium]